MTSEIVERVLRSSRYRDVDPALLGRLAEEELARARNVDDAVKRVKRRLHQAVGAFRGSRRASRLADAWNGDLEDPVFRDACIEAMRGHASTRERLNAIDALYPAIWSVTGTPGSVLDLGCGLNPLTLPWMGISPVARYTASDVDRRPLSTVTAFLELVGQAHRIEVRDLVSDPPEERADVALLLKLVTTLDRQDPGAAARLIDALDVRHVVLSFPLRSLGGGKRGMGRTYRARLDRLLEASVRARTLTEVPVPDELVAVVGLDG
ncbi:MAG: 16S rRNA methyltransferase [Candidatus Limnocylindria bacterium]